MIGFNRFDGVTPAVGDTHWWNLSANLKYELSSASLRPYVNGGVGLYIPETGSSMAGYNIGVGLDYSNSPGWNLELGIDHHEVFTNSANTRFMVPRIGGVYRF